MFIKFFLGIFLFFVGCSFNGIFYRGFMFFFWLKRIYFTLSTIIFRVLNCMRGGFRFEVKNIYFDGGILRRENCFLVFGRYILGNVVVCIFINWMF